MGNRLIQDLKDAWRNVSSTTIGFATNVPAEKWDSKPFNPRFKPFSWEFACLTRTRICYLKGLKTGQLVFSHQDDIPDKNVIESKSKKEILDLLTQLSRELLKEIEIIKEENFGKVLWLLQHERIHHGKLMLYFSQAGYALPESLVKTWGESNFPKQSV